MKMKRVSNYIFIGIVMTLVLTACSDRFSDDDPRRFGRDGILAVTIAGGDDAGTRVARSSVDGWSYTRFSSETDVIGFYSLYGNLDGEDGNGPFTNEPMEYAGGQLTPNRPDEDRYWQGVFRPINMNYDLALIKNDVASTFVYFPYCEDMEEDGMELRIYDEEKKIYRCVDALAISKIKDDGNGEMMDGSFNHTFAEIVIIRGYGFDEPKEGLDGIKVVTTLPYSHAKVVDNENKNHDDWKILKPVYNESYDKLTMQECREWVAWDGADYVDDNNIRHPAKYVIIPTAISNDRSTVNYVEIYDNTGTCHKVTTFGLMTDTDKRVSPNDRYYLTVKLEGLVPAIYPFAITAWEEPERYTEQRARGINTAEEFVDFVMAYNRYNGGGREQTDEEGLKNFGDRYEVNGDVGWHFHINNDLDFSRLEVVGDLNIVNLCDTLDGRTKTLSGIKTKKAFITEMQTKGCIRNLNISGLNVTSTSAPAGGLIDRMTGGLVTGCEVDGYLSASGAAGLAVGWFSAGTISNCYFSGLVMGTSSYEREGLVGEAPNDISSEMMKGVNSNINYVETGN